MTGDISDAISAIRKIAPTLNKATDDAAQTVRAVEAFLEQQSIGLPCEVEAEAQQVVVNNDPGAGRCDYDATNVVLLAYERYGPRYRIVTKIQQITHIGNDDVKVKDLEVNDWLSAPRELKLATFPYLPELLKELAKKAGSIAKRTGEAVTTVTEIMAALGSEPKLRLIKRPSAQQS